MPSIYDLKPRFQSLLRPAMRAMAAIGITPNMVTIAAIAGSAIAAWCGIQYTLLAFPLWLFLRMALNAIDGMMARELNQASRLGAILNELGDVLSDVLLYLPLAILIPNPWPVIVFIFLAMLTEFCGVLQQALTGVRRYDGPMGKSDRAFAVGLLTLITAVSTAVFAYWGLAFSACSLLALLTCVNRLRTRT